MLCLYVKFQSWYELGLAWLKAFQQTSGELKFAMWSAVTMGVIYQISLHVITTGSSDNMCLFTWDDHQSKVELMNHYDFWGKKR